MEAVVVGTGPRKSGAWLFALSQGQASGGTPNKGRWHACGTGFGLAL